MSNKIKYLTSSSECDHAEPKTIKHIRELRDVAILVDVNVTSLPQIRNHIILVNAVEVTNIANPATFNL